MRPAYPPLPVKIVALANLMCSGFDTLSLSAAFDRSPAMTSSPLIPSQSQSPSAGAPPVWLSRLPGLVLASQSPRRGQLLHEHGLAHEAMHPGVDDGLLEPGQVPPEQWVKALAYYKARAGARLLAGSAEPKLVIAADTICVMDGRVIGQPADATEAETMVREFAGRDHDVFTGVAVLPAGPGATKNPHRVIFAETARVWLGSLSEPQISDYVSSDGWRGKAGGYNLSERLKAGWPIRFTGDVSTIVGLPMRPLLDRLERMAIGAG